LEVEINFAKEDGTTEGNQKFSINNEETTWSTNKKACNGRGIGGIFLRIKIPHGLYPIEKAIKKTS